MTEVTHPGPTTPAATQRQATRLRQRYAAERRFRAYGLIAIAIAGTFLVALLGDILYRGLPAFWVHKAELTVTLRADDIDPQGSGDPAVIARGNFAAVVNNALYQMFPSVTDRAHRKALRSLMSGGAADRLRELAVANPALVGTSFSLPLLLSDDADILFKGGITGVTAAPGLGTITPSGTEGEIVLTIDGSDFRPEIERIKATVVQLSARADAEQERLRNVITRLKGEVDGTRRDYEAVADKTSAEAEALKAALARAESDLAGVQTSFDRITAQADDFRRRLEATGATDRLSSNLPSLLVRLNEGVVKLTQVDLKQAKGEVLLPLTSAAAAGPGTWTRLFYAAPESERRMSDREVTWLLDIERRGLIDKAFNWAFFTSGDSREPEQAGVLGGMVGSALMLLVTLALCLPIGVAAAIYLEAFAPRNRITQIIEVNINNLAAVPSIVFGLLGLAVFLNFFGMPRSAPVLGGTVLALMTLPTIIIASRAALRAVPPSILEGALGVGASRQQAVFHHVLPQAMPGILTGTILGMAQALGETAPLLMIGMVAFIVDIPGGITDAATALPVQIYLWSDLPEAAFQSKTAAAIIVLLGFLFVMNATAIFLRKRFERRW